MNRTYDVVVVVAGTPASKVTKSHCEGAPKRIGKMD